MRVKELNPQKAVVTGGAGFIGSHLGEGLIKRGYHVIILDDLSTGKLENIKELLKGDAEFVRGSVTDLPLLRRLFQGAGYAFHQAAQVKIPQSIVDPLTNHEVNIRGTLNVLIAARDSGVKKVIFASSSSVYGDTSTLPQKEDSILKPLSPYAVTKLAGEYYCAIFRQIYQLPTACLRYFNVYGARQDHRSQYAAAVPIFIDKVARNLPPVIFGDGEQTRDFVFVQDVVRANILAAETAAEGVYNIGGGQSVTVNQLAEAIIKLMGKNLAPVHDAPRPGEVRHSLADIGRAKSFGWAPAWTLTEGLKKTIGGIDGGV